MGFIAEAMYRDGGKLNGPGPSGGWPGEPTRAKAEAMYPDGGKLTGPGPYYIQSVG